MKRVETAQGDQNSGNKGAGEAESRGIKGHEKVIRAIGTQPWLCWKVTEQLHTIPSHHSGKMVEVEMVQLLVYLGFP